ncbi:MAG TPA: MATE family efflux transporter [Acidobacteriota bacterium]|nr:MATE family efflux transporter [Acidobacteriota bacterium]HQP18659.1 MATE family efflux transporter [Candidatus Cloacimonadota bacterium]
MPLKLDLELSRQVWRLAYPICLGNLSQILLGVVDTAMLGRLSPVALAAAGIGAVAYLTVISTLGALSMGTQALTARRHGEKEMAQCGQVLDNSLALAIVLGGAFTLSSPWFAQILFPLLESGPQMGSLLGIYMQYRFYGAVFALFNLAFAGFFNGIGQTKVRMIAAIILTSANILLNWLLIFGNLGFPKLGVQGAAIASTLATALASLYYLGVSLGKGYRSTYGYFRPANVDPSEMCKIGRLSLPLMLRYLVGMGGYLAFFWIVGRIGTLEVAASNIIRSILSISWMFGTSMGAAATTLVGQNMGAKKYKEAELSSWEAVKLSIIFMGIVGALFLFFPSPLMRIYTDDLGVISAGIPVLRLLSIAQIFAAIGLVLSSAFIGAGDMRFVLGVEVGNTCLVYLPLAWWLGVHLGLGLLGAWSAEVIYNLIPALMMSARFRGGSWKGIRI